MNVKENVKISEITRTVSGRITRGTDLITGIKEICREYGIKHGYIGMLIGSLDIGTFVYAVKDDSSKLNIKYSDNVVVEGPLELLCAQGLIGLDESGELSVHLHMLVSDRYMRVYGGHFVEGENPIAVTGEIVIHEIGDSDLIRKPDEETGFTIFKIV
ncbi:DNA-binding protein [Sedimentibacter sp.]|uniref:PPC domain-containing DNA-binding protein n=1 Tax=Sedimentibacter sp. TaxID=1960295 RepID=UPI0028A01D3A|nr:DNA-binding protein [Sedimentibacter sp.]